MSIIKKLLNPLIEGTKTFQRYSEQDKEDLAWMECYKDQMPYIKKMITTIEGNMKNGKISKQEHNAELQAYWAFRKSF